MYSLSNTKKTLTLLNLIGVKSIHLIVCIHISNNVLSFKKENTWTLVHFYNL